ncbi:hypothetical protein PQ459_01740 [Chryseobacterium sp. KACC 21268]|nr:hypothetical protein PQ459_01740 [Chryseobacterium sp. KACC 21268]
MQAQLKPRKVDFNLGIYISQAIDLMKKDFGTVLLSFIFAMILGIIPFCGLMAIGNFYKVCYKLDKGIPAKADEVFNFDDFMPYFIFQIYMIGAFFLILIPFAFIGIFSDNDGIVSGFVRGIGMVYILGVYFVIIYFLLQAFYIPALITFKNIKDLKIAWNISKIMSKGNLWQILFFSIVASFLSQLGILACGIGLIFTLPFLYVSHYFAFKDGLAQIEYDDITEIGQNY